MRCDKTLALVIVVCKYGDEIIEKGESKKENNGKMTASWKRDIDIASFQNLNKKLNIWFV